MHSYLRKKDKRLCETIDRIGHIDRAMDTDPAETPQDANKYFEV